MDPVHIGVKELYDLLKEVDAKLDHHTLQYALLEQRVIQIERREDRRWAVWLALITAVIALLVGTLQPFITR